MDMSARTRYNTRMVTSAVNPSLPTWARLPINRCSLPAVLLGSLSYQRHPVPLALDGVLELYRCLFTRLDALEDVSERAGMFERHMRAEFSMENPEAAGFRAGQPAARAKAHYLRMVRGWSFDSDGREGAARSLPASTCGAKPVESAAARMLPTRMDCIRSALPL